MLFENIEIGTRLEITMKPTEKKVKSKVYISSVEAILSPNVLLLHVPISAGQLVKLPLKGGYSFLFFTGKEMVRFDASLESYLKQNGKYLIRVKLDSSGEPVQRRDYFRLSCLLPLQFSRILVEDEMAEEGSLQEPEVFEGLIKDISGGGIRFSANESLERNEKIQCILKLASETFLLIGKILYKQILSDAIYQYQYRVKFIGLTTSERERIVQYIFDEQKKAIKRVSK